MSVAGDVDGVVSMLIDPATARQQFQLTRGGLSYLSAGVDRAGGGGGVAGGGVMKIMTVMAVVSGLIRLLAF